MFKVLLNGRLFAAIAAGVVISTGVIAMSGNPALSNSNSTSGASFMIDEVRFAATGFNTSSCSLLNGVVILKIKGLTGDQRLMSATIGGEDISLENTYTHAGETTIALLDYPWLQGYKYHVTVTSESQVTVEADSPITPIVTPSNITIKSLSFKGPTVRLNLENHGTCNAYISEVLVSGPNITNEINILYAPVGIQPGKSSSLTLLASFTPQIHATYNFTFIVAGSALTGSTIAYPITPSGNPFSKLN